MFVLWGVWGILAASRRAALLGAPGRRRGARAMGDAERDELGVGAPPRTWHAPPVARCLRLPGGPSAAVTPWAHYLLSRAEPLLKVLLPLVGIAGELYINTGSWHSMMLPDGRIDGEHLNNWQHSVMYAAFVLVGSVELLADAAPRLVPPGACALATALAFFLEGILFAFHLKGSVVEIKTHLVLVLSILLCTLAATAEGLRPRAPLAALARHAAVLLQGIWFCQAAVILFGNQFSGGPKWEDSHVSAMALPPVFAAWALAVLAFTFGAAAAAAWLTGGSLEAPASNAVLSVVTADADAGPLLGHRLSSFDAGAGAPTEASLKQKIAPQVYEAYARS